MDKLIQIIMQLAECYLYFGKRKNRHMQNIYKEKTNDSNCLISTLKDKKLRAKYFLFISNSD